MRSWGSFGGLGVSGWRGKGQAALHPQAREVYTLRTGAKVLPGPVLAVAAAHGIGTALRILAEGPFLLALCLLASVQKAEVTLCACSGDARRPPTPRRPCQLLLQGTHCNLPFRRAGLGWAGSPSESGVHTPGCWETLGPL